MTINLNKQTVMQTVKRLVLQLNTASVEPSVFSYLHAEISQLIHHIRKREAQYMDQVVCAEKTSACYPSLVNLAHYLAMRELDRQSMETLADELAAAGLASLDAVEAHVMASLTAMLQLLNCGSDTPEGLFTGQLAGFDYPLRKTGQAILQNNRVAVLGRACNENTPVGAKCIAVTLPDEAATDYRLVGQLVRSGMTIARIQCARGNAAQWRQMIGNVRRAVLDNHASCRILMELAGRQARIGAIFNDPQSLYIKVKKNGDGKSARPIRFVIVPDEQGKSIAARELNQAFVIPVPRAVYANLSHHDRLSLVDVRGKLRHITITKASDEHAVLGYCEKTVHLMTGLPVTWQRCFDLQCGDYREEHTFRFVNVNSAAGKVRLRIGDCVFLHKRQIWSFIENDTSRGASAYAAHIQCSVPEIIDLLELGARVWIDQGKLSAYVCEKTGGYVVLRITKTHARAGGKAVSRGVRLKTGMQLDFPGTVLDGLALTNKDCSDLGFICDHADMVGLPGIETASDMRALTAALRQRNACALPVVLTVEATRVARYLPNILFSALPVHPISVMVVGGSIAWSGNQAVVSSGADIRQEIMQLCRAAHVPVVWAPYALESTVRYSARNRLELADAVLQIRAEGVLLNYGENIVQALQLLQTALRGGRCRHHGITLPLHD